ncbi:hypothetical protein [Mucilaginibacter segetis]|uniref:Uncharacterized protein n=1 Tax=Mucilaginibacter segetis TaxID=2793071 RepID=A0A934PSC9_9SPHI|nr:hypothetical protein [Mucilaginibacter segetis]MBK0379908.1 hypothetical protein [Mucilaginibacter segetis]
MKKHKIKILAKTAKKEAQENLRSAIASDLKQITEKLGLNGKKTNKEIAKSAKHLAKKLAKGIKIDKTALMEIANEKPAKAPATAPTADKAEETPKAAPASANKATNATTQKTAPAKPAAAKK